MFFICSLMLVCFIFLDVVQDLFLYLFLGLFPLYFFFWAADKKVHVLPNCSERRAGLSCWTSCALFGSWKMHPCLYSAIEEQDVHGAEQMLPDSVLGHVPGRKASVPGFPPPSLSLGEDRISLLSVETLYPPLWCCLVRCFERGFAARGVRMDQPC